MSTNPPSGRPPTPLDAPPLELPTRPAADELVTVGVSGIHGTGLFAVRDIPADTPLGVAEGVATRRNGPHVLWYDDERGVQRGLVVTNVLRYANHARPGNAAFYGLEMWSTAAIPAGAEVTLDYGTDW
ncbi:MAG: SET domain-containing protein [Planctomycetota bacterium]